MIFCFFRSRIGPINSTSLPTVFFFFCRYTYSFFPREAQQHWIELSRSFSFSLWKNLKMHNTRSSSLRNPGTPIDSRPILLLFRPLSPALLRGDSQAEWNLIHTCSSTCPQTVRTVRKTYALYQTHPRLLKAVERLVRGPRGPRGERLLVGEEPTGTWGHCGWRQVVSAWCDSRPREAFKNSVRDSL